MPPNYWKANNWLHWSQFLPNIHDREWISNIYSIKNGIRTGFISHFTGDSSKLSKKLCKTKDSPEQQFHLFSDVLRRLKVGTLVKCRPQDIDHIVPIYLLRKRKNWASPCPIYKNRIIYNYASKNSLNEHIPDMHRKMRYPPILSTLCDLIYAQIDKYGQCWMGSGDVLTGFENLWSNKSVTRLWGFNIKSQCFRSLVGNYGDASKPRQMHRICLVRLIDIYHYQKWKYDLGFNISQFH